MSYNFVVPVWHSLVDLTDLEGSATWGHRQRGTGLEGLGEAGCLLTRPRSLWQRRLRRVRNIYFSTFHHRKSRGSCSSRSWIGSSDAKGPDIFAAGRSADLRRGVESGLWWEWEELRGLAGPLDLRFLEMTSWLSYITSLGRFLIHENPPFIVSGGRWLRMIGKPSSFWATTCWR